jgi:hypothetical protein
MVLPARFASFFERLQKRPMLVVILFESPGISRIFPLRFVRPTM